MNLSEVKSTQEIEIDFKAFFLKLQSMWRYLVIGTLSGALIMLLYATFVITPMYEASSQVYLRGSKNNVSLSELQIGAELTSDYGIIFKSRPNMEKVINELKLDIGVKELRSMIEIENLSDTRILEVIVKSEDPNLSRDIANSVVEHGMDSVREIDSKEPYLIENAIANNNPTGTSKKTYVLLGGIMGFMATAGAIFIIFMMSDTIQSAEDIESCLGLPVLGIVIEDDSMTYLKKGTRRNNTKRKDGRKRWK